MLGAGDSGSTACLACSQHLNSRPTTPRASSRGAPMVGRKVSEETRREDILRAAYDVAARQGLEALTLRAVAARADVSHGTVLFHFKRKHELVASLLDRVLYATAVLRITDGVAQITRPSERMHALL